MKSEDIANKIIISKAFSDINRSILTLKEEVAKYSEALNIVEAQYGKNSKAAEISTVFAFFNLSMLDIFILSKQYMSTNDVIEKNFICRTAAHHMYEFLEDGGRAIGNQMNSLTEKLKNLEIDQNLKELRKSFNELKQEFHSSLKKLRHNVSGHKDRDIRQQLAISNSIDIDSFQETFFRFILFFVTLTKFKHLVHKAAKNMDQSKTK